MKNIKIDYEFNHNTKVLTVYNIEIISKDEYDELYENEEVGGLDYDLVPDKKVCKQKDEEPKMKLKFKDNQQNFRKIFAKDPFFKDLTIRKDLWSGDTEVFGSITYPNGYKRTFDESSKEEEVILTLKEIFESRYNMPAKKDGISDAIANVALGNTYHSIQEIVDSKEWNGIDRKSSFFEDCLGVDMSKEVNQRYAEVFFGGLMARLYKPGTKFDYHLVLCGGAGGSKTTLFKRLTFGHCVEIEAYSDSNNERNFERQRAWIINDDEQVTMKSSKIEKTKAFITATEDTYREKYQRRATIHKRKFVTVSTTNDPYFYEIFKNEDGGRRIMPMVCGEVEPKYTNLIDDLSDEYFQQVLAQAKFEWEEKYLYTKDSGGNLVERAEPAPYFTREEEQELESYRLLFTKPENKEEKEQQEKDKQRRLDNVKAYLEKHNKEIICTKMIAMEVFHKTEADWTCINKDLDEILDHLEGWERRTNKDNAGKKATIKNYRQQSKWWVKLDKAENTETA